jgi:hypothetical protein
VGVQYYGTLDSPQKQTLFQNLMFCGLCIAIYQYNKYQQDTLFTCSFILINNLYMFQAGLLLIIRRYDYVYAAVGICWYMSCVYVSSGSEWDCSPTLILLDFKENLLYTSLTRKYPCNYCTFWFGHLEFVVLWMP